MLYFSINLIIAASGVAIEKKIFNPLTIFMGLWAIIFALSPLQLFKLYLASKDTFSILFIGTIFFALGYYIHVLLISKKVVIFRFSSNYNKNKENVILRNKLVKILLFLCILLYFKDFVTIIYMLHDFNLQNIQDWLRSPENIIKYSSIENAIRFLFVAPFTTAITAITAVEFWFGKRDKVFFSLLITMIILRILTTGGRASLLQLVFYLLVAFTFCKPKLSKNITDHVRNRWKSEKKLIIVISLVSFALLIIMSISRAGSAFVKTIYNDFAMQPYMFEYWANQADSFNLKGYGMASINGFIHPFMYILRNIRLIDNFPIYYQKIFDIISLTDTTWVGIGKGVFANAYVSVFWSLYLDGRDAGIIIGMLLYGLISRTIYNNCCYRITQKRLAIYCVFLMGLAFSFVRLQFTLSSYALSFVYIIIMYRSNFRIRNTKHTERIFP